jgi:dTDP-4-dehydrorhamnose 3,5-epimerase-like enzyme
MIPKIIKGNSHTDLRGDLFYNNNFDLSAIRRIYIIENKSIDYIRAWQGHKVEQRWFTASNGAYKIRLIKVDNWELPSEHLEVIEFNLNAEKLDVLHVPQGYISSIQSLQKGSKLLVMSDYLLGEISDEYRFDADYFKS